MTQEQERKLKDWLIKRSNKDLVKLYRLLQYEALFRDLILDESKEIFDNRIDNPDVIQKGLNNYFENVYDKHHG